LRKKEQFMPTVLNELEAKRNTLAAFIHFHRQFADGMIRVVRMPVDGATPEVGLGMDSFTEGDVKCRQIHGGWACLIHHLHLSKTQKGMPHIFEYEVEDDPTKARYDCKPASQATRALLK
jgi:hypothetical protein